MNEKQLTMLPKAIKNIQSCDSRIGDYEICRKHDSCSFPVLLIKKGFSVGTFQSERVAEHVARALTTQEILQDTLNPTVLEILLECITDFQPQILESSEKL